MRVNYTCKGFLDRPPVVRTGVIAVIFGVCFIASSFTTPPDRELWAKQVNIMIREMGHRLLLRAGDSTSRVLPVTEIRRGTFQLTFENEFALDDESLVKLSLDLLPKTDFPSGYTVTVHESRKSDIVYGFQVSKDSRDIIPCLGRVQPMGRYWIEISFPDLYEKWNDAKTIKRSSADIRQTSFPLVTVIFSVALVLLGITLLIGRFRTILKPVQVKDHEHPTVKQIVPELPSIGTFLFDEKDHRLLYRDEVITLTDKECRILAMLNKNFGELTLRETLLQEVWVSEGVITGRSLDMFVSKLRKKLSRDAGLRITNIHGKGYKLEMNLS